ncbi:mpv17-like protein isoform X2 [Macaca fascicularis]|uniref:mpv17-like protein isoform X2 n=1 Tax=Macaca fascicularis TaxID=9541 RepID=UPI003D154B76
MAGWWPALSRAARRHPWPTNVLLYGSLFSAGDALQQRLQGREADWRQTRRVATLAVTFHANFNYVWLGLLERALPGRAPRAVLAKLLWDQVVGAPIVVSAFYTERTGVLAFCTGKFRLLSTINSGLWFPCGPNELSVSVPAVPVQWRTAYTGVCGFLWAIFVCFSQQSGDGTLKSAFTILRTKWTSAIEGSPEK